MTPDRRGRILLQVAGAMTLVAWFVWLVWFARVGESYEAGEHGRMEVVFLEADYGDATWIKTPSGKNVLVDAGPGQSGSLAGKDQRLNYNKDTVRFSLAESLGEEELDAVIFTNTLYGHWGGFEAFLAGRKRRLGKVFVPKILRPTSRFRGFLKRLAGRGGVVEELEVGRDVPLGDDKIRLKVLGPRRSFQNGPADDANRSLVLHLIHKNISVLLASDLEEEGEFDVLEEGESLTATVLKVSAHGHRNSSSTPFLDWIRPEVAIISVDTPNPFGTPHSETLQKLRDRGIEYFRTDLHGDIVLVSNGLRWKIGTSR